MLGTPLLSETDARVEAALFASARPLAERDLLPLLAGDADLGAVLRRLQAFWTGRGIVLERQASGWILRADEDLVPKGGDPSGMRRLSEAAGATLMTIAMHQPATVTQIEEVRGVKLAREILEGLEGAGLIEAVGRRTGTGRAVAWGTTEKFLEWAGLDSLADLPTPEEALLLLDLS